MKISIIHPSRGRPEQAFKTASQWLNKADTVIEYLLSIDLDDPRLLDYNRLLLPICSGYNIGAIEAINRASKLVIGDLLIVVSDDFDCPLHWDTLLIEALQGKSDFCAKTIDGHQDWLITLPILDRVFYERFSYIYHPSYTHMYADLEMTCVAWMLDKYISLPIEFKHLHPVVTHRHLDAINIRNNQSWGQGKQNFRERIKTNFKIDPVKELPANALHKQGL